MTKAIKIPHEVDKRVGAQVRMARMMVNMSQEKLGDSLGLTFQQVQKYEKGVNRVSASRLQQIADIFGKPVEWFFSGASTPAAVLTVGEVDPIVELSQSPAGVALARAFRDIPDGGTRRLLVSVAENFAERFQQHLAPQVCEHSGALLSRKKSA